MTVPQLGEAADSYRKIPGEIPEQGVCGVCGEKSETAASLPIVTIQQ
jgi:hypothetical protein